MSGKESMAKKARTNQKRVQKTAKLGSGARFKALEKAVATGGAKNPGAVAAAIGRKSLGKAKFQKLASQGRKRTLRKGRGSK